MWSRRHSGIAVALVVSGVLLVAPAAAVARRDTDPRVEALGLLIEKPGKGPELCLGPVELSLPPNCDGIPVTGADFDSMPRSVRVEASDGVRWVDWAVVRGRLHGRTLRMTSVSPIRRTEADPAARSEYDAPNATCPTDGRPGVQPYEAAAFLDEVAAQFPTTFAGGWIDQHGVVSARFTDAPGTYREQLTARFGGALCVGRAPFTLSGLEEVQARVFAEGLAVAAQHDRRILSGDVNQFATTLTSSSTCPRQRRCAPSCDACSVTRCTSPARCASSSPARSAYAPAL